MLNMRTIQAKLIIGFALGPVILAIIGWMVKKRIASRGDPAESTDEKPDRKIENMLDLPNEERWE